MAIPYSRYFLGGVPWYSVLILCGILCAVWLTGLECKRRELPRDTAVDIALVCVPTGIIGARLYYVAMSWQQFAANPISALYVWEGGIAIYGGVIGGALGALVYAKRKKLSFLELADCTVPGLLLAQAIGRWGNYFNMEAFGPEITNAAFQFFPVGVLISEGGQWVWHMATFFYEFIWNVAGFTALWLMRKRQRQHGSMLMWYFLIYGAGRFIIEQLRQDSLYLGGIRASQYLSLILCIVAACVLLWHVMKRSRTRFALSVGAVLLLVARWFALNSTVWYAALLTAAMVCAVLSLRESRNAPWLALPLAIDLLGLILLWCGFPTEPLALRIHTLLCSVTLPIYVWMLAASASEADPAQ